MLTLDGVSSGYAGQPAIAGVHISVPAGAAVALLGANGAGKTTVIRTVAGLMQRYRGRVTSGSITFDGGRLDGLASHVIARRGVAHVPEGRMIFANLTVRENLMLGSPRRSSSHQQESAISGVVDLFPTLGDRLNQRGGWLSGGQQQMLAIGRALMSSPRLVLFDEISLGLAPQIVRTIFERLAVVRRETGTAMLVVEQNARIALEFCDSGYVLEGGRIMLDGSADLLRGDARMQDLYLGGAAGGDSRSFADARRFRRRAGWLS
jgi:branched-chain amino acid transport system ATP-binding protein